MERDVQTRLSYLRDDILGCITQASDRSKLGRENETKLKNVDARMDECTKSKEMLVEAINYLVNIYKNVEKYTEERKEISKERLELAVKRAGFIVPDAETAGISLSIKDGKSRVLTKEGRNVNNAEGSAFRATMGLLMSYTCIKEQPDALQVMILDEAVSTLSDDSGANFKEYLEAFKEDMLVIGIEQRNHMYQISGKTTFRASKENGITTIRKEE